jgi:hypothetical protein
MPDPQQNDISEALGKVTKGLTALKEVWGFASKVAALQDKYKGQAIPVGELFRTMLGFGDKPNPLEFVEKQLAEINAKLDRVLAGIEELKIGQLGQGVLAAYLDMSDPVYLIEKYFHDLVGYQDGAQPWTEAERKEFVDKLLGTRSERDSVAFCTHKIVKLSPVTQSPLLFDLLFPYLLAGARAENAREIYLKGAFAFRAVAETLNKGLLLESFAAASAGGDAKRVEARVKAVTDKYKVLMRAMTENSFLPFAERLAAFNFKGEYFGGHEMTEDVNRPLVGWGPATPSILQSADDLAGKLMGESKGVTLRVVPNIPPIAVIIPSKNTGPVASGNYRWEVFVPPTKTSLTRDNLLDKMQPGEKPFFHLKPKNTGASYLPESIRKVELSLAEGTAVPLGFDRKRLNLLRYRFDVSALPDGAAFSFYIFNTDGAREFPSLTTVWKRYYVEADKGVEHKWEEREGPLSASQLVLDKEPGEFKLPPDGQLIPVLVTYASARFGSSPS